MEDEPTIFIRAVSKWYGTFQALTDCSTDIGNGEVVVVCGPSGCGKNTLIKCVNGLEPFQQGDIVVDSISVGDRKIDLPKLRSHVGMVFQHFELFPHITVTDNLAIAQIKVLGRTEEAATVKGLKLLERVGLRSASVTRVRIPISESGAPVNGQSSTVFPKVRFCTSNVSGVRRISRRTSFSLRAVHCPFRRSHIFAV
jgi:ABC-type polar amino acid transport system ATPase subunit